MWDYIGQHIAQVIAFFVKYPEFLAILCATLGSWALGALSEYFMPVTWPTRAQRQITLLVNVCSGTIICAVMWFALDHVDPRGVRLMVSLVCGVTSPFSYIFVGRVLGHYFPWATAWGKQP